MQSDKKNTTSNKGGWNVTGQASATKHKPKQSVSSAQPAINHYRKLSNGNSEFNHTIKPQTGKATETGIMEMKRVPVNGSDGSKAGGATTGPTSIRSSKKFKSRQE